jgi:hypothetical protein
VETECISQKETAIYGICVYSVFVQAVPTYRRSDNAADGKDMETLQHQNALSGSDNQDGKRAFRNNLTEVSISAGFWPHGAFQGVSFNLGGIIKDRSGPDIFCSIGYTVPIWKGLAADLGYRLLIMETIKNKAIQYNGIRIGISYVF